ncbi:MAG: hypothetical protein AB7P21_20485 [Lautropia sp.]
MQRPLTLHELQLTAEYRAGGWPLRLCADDSRIPGVYPTGETGWFMPTFGHASRFARERARLFGEPFSISEIDGCWFVFEPSFARIDVDGEPDRWVPRIAFPAIAADDAFELRCAIKAWLDALVEDDPAADARSAPPRRRDAEGRQSS